MFLKIKMLIAAILVSGMLINSFGQTQERVVIKSMIGKVQIRTPKSGQWRPARVGMPVKMKWDIRTYVESSAELKFENGTVLKIGENSVVGLSKILQDKANGISKSDVKVATGQVWGNVKKLVNKNSSFNFETPTAVAAIRGTILGIDVSNGKTTVDVVEGKVAVRNKGSNKTVMVETGRRAVVKKGEDNIETMNTEASDPFVQDTALVDTVKKDTTIVDSTIIDSTLLDSTLIDSLADSLNVDSLITDSLLQDSLTSDTAITDTIPSDSIEIDTSASTDEAELELAIEEPAKGDTVDDASVSVRGTVTEGAKVIVNNSPVTVSGGKFSADVALIEGDNAIEILAELDGQQAREVVLIVYNPIGQDVELTISAPSDGDTLEAPVVQVEGTATEGSEVTVNGAPVPLSGNKFINSLSLMPGVNRIEVNAKLKTSSASEVINIYFDPPKDLFLSVVVPSKTTSTEIVINGATTPGAEVSVDGNDVTVLPDGSFSYKYLIPDEEGDYSCEIISSYKGKEMVEVSTVTYEPEYEVKSLVLNEVALKGDKISVSGVANPNSEIDINGFTMIAAPDGKFQYEISVSEKDIGDYVVEITATDERTGEEQSKATTVSIPVTNNVINTSTPSLSMVGQISKATKNSSLSFVATDLTPNDELVITINSDENEVESGEVLSYSLSDGENKITASAKDLAGNVSNTVTEVIYYLPGPLAIEINEPDESMFNIDDLPPMPKNTGSLRMDVEIEIDDGIGTTASEDQILYVKLNGALLQSKGNFRYTGSVAVYRGSNSFTVTAEDAAGNTAVKQFTVNISE